MKRKMNVPVGSQPESQAVATLKIVTESADQTRSLGAQLGALLRSGDLIALTGDLGAGKTTLTQGIGSGLGIKTYLRSPTFTLVNEYRLEDATILLHLDGYRLGETIAEAMLEADTFGLSQLLEDENAIVVIEWADRVTDLLPDDRVDISIDYDDAEEKMRLLAFCAHGPRGRTLLTRLQDVRSAN